MQQRNPFFVFFETFTRICSRKITIMIDYWLYDREWSAPFALRGVAKREI